MTELAASLARVLAVTALAVPLIYVLHSLAAGRRIPLEPYALALHMSAAFLVMAVMVAGLGFLHGEVFGWRMWEYRVYPNHHEYGSYLGPLTWPWYGFHVYLLDRVLAARGRALPRVWQHGLVTGVDGPLLEILGNGLFLLLFGSYFFYYFPPELGHLTSVLVMPYYAVAGMVLYVILRALREANPRWSLPLALYFTGLCFVVLG